MEQLAAQIFSGGRVAGEIDRPVVDRTGLAGRFDFTLEYGPQSSDELAKLPAVEGTSPNAVRMPFRHALREQLGLHLVPSTAPIRSLIIDHVEKPSAK